MEESLTLETVLDALADRMAQWVRAKLQGALGGGADPPCSADVAVRTNP